MNMHRTFAAVIAVFLFQIVTVDAHASMTDDMDEFVTFRGGMISLSHERNIKNIKAQDFLIDGVAMDAVVFDPTYGLPYTDENKGRKFIFNNGYAGSIAYELNIGTLRFDIEAEFATQKPSDYDKIARYDEIAVQAGLGGGVAAEYSVSTQKGLQRYSVIPNIQSNLVRLGDDSKVSLFIGVGAGIGVIQFLGVSKFKTLYQIRADVEYNIDEEWSGIMSIKHVDVFDSEMSSVYFRKSTDSTQKATAKIEADFVTRELQFGIKRAIF